MKQVFQDRKTLSKYLYKWFGRYPTSKEIHFYEANGFPKKEEHMNKEERERLKLQTSFLEKTKEVEKKEENKVLSSREKKIYLSYIASNYPEICKRQLKEVLDYHARTKKSIPKVVQDVLYKKKQVVDNYIDL